MDKNIGIRQVQDKMILKQKPQGNIHKSENVNDTQIIENKSPSKLINPLLANIDESADFGATGEGKT